MTRSRATARKAGPAFERLIADYLKERLGDDRIDRRVKTGNKDRGDIGGVLFHGHRLVIECKNVMKLALPAWTREAEVERGNDDALAGVVVHKRHGSGKPGEQWVTMTVDQLIALITEERPES